MNEWSKIINLWVNKYTIQANISQVISRVSTFIRDVLKFYWGFFRYSNRFDSERESHYKFCIFVRFSNKRVWTRFIIRVNIIDDDILTVISRLR